jgi:hypothetical protein
VTNNNGFLIGCLDLLTASFTITLNHNQLQKLTLNLQPNTYFWTAADSLHSRSRSRSHSHSTADFSASESELLYYWRYTANEYVLATSPLRLKTSNFIFQVNTCNYSPYVTSPLTRDWVCRLQTLLVLASAVILRSESGGTQVNILLSQIRDFLNLEGQVPVFIYPRNREVQFYPQALG